MAVSCMRNASGHNYRHSSVIVDLAMGHIPRSTKRITSYTENCLFNMMSLWLSWTATLVVPQKVLFTAFTTNTLHSLFSDTVFFPKISTCKAATGNCWLSRQTVKYISARILGFSIKIFLSALLITKSKALLYMQFICYDEDTQPLLIMDANPAVLYQF